MTSCAHSTSHTIEIKDLDDIYVKQVLVSKNSQLKIGSDALIKLAPIEKSPSNIEDFIVKYSESLPQWYSQAIFYSSSENECQVNINNEDYTLILENYVWYTYFDNASKVKALFDDIGVKSKIRVDNAITYGVCEYIKTSDIDKAMKIVLGYKENE